MNCLAVDRFEMLLSAAIDVEKVDKIFPSLVECYQIGRQGRGTGEFLVVVLDLFLKPAKVLDRLAFTWGKCLDQFLAGVPVFEKQPFFFATLDKLAVPRQIRQRQHISDLEHQRDQQRNYASGISRGHGKAGKAPKVKWFL